MIDTYHDMPPALWEHCRLTVCIPARNEASFIGATLAALSVQCDLSGRPLPHRVFDILVFANNCNDDTARVVRRIAGSTPHVDIFTIEATLGPGEAHIGAARKRVMDTATARFLAANRPEGILASLDSDTLADRHWIAALMREIRGRDAVAGQVTIAGADYESLLAPVRLLYARELTYRRVLAEVEALIDPRPEDPQPRHGSFVGASFAVTAKAYVAAGGVPPLARLEDVAFSRALQRIDARVRYSPAVRASTSARLSARVAGGFGSFLAELHECAQRGESFLVEHPRQSLDDMTIRAAIRRIRRGSERPGDIEGTADLLRLAPAQWLPPLSDAASDGAAYESILERAASRRHRYPPAQVECAIASLRTAASARRIRLVGGKTEDARVDADMMTNRDAG